MPAVLGAKKEIVVHGETHMTRLLRTLSIFVLVLTVTGLASGQSDPRIGTWKLNVAESKFDPAASRKNETRTYQMSDGAVMVHVEVTLSDGSKQEVSFDGTPDGKDHPYNATPAFYADTISVRREGNGFVGESKKDGKLLFTTTDTFSAYGKVLTLTTSERKGPVSQQRQGLRETVIYNRCWTGDFAPNLSLITSQGRIQLSGFDGRPTQTQTVG